jgi:hypothetical protein
METSSPRSGDGLAAGGRLTWLLILRAFWASAFFAVLAYGVGFLLRLHLPALGADLGQVLQNTGGRLLHGRKAILAGLVFKVDNKQIRLGFVHHHEGEINGHS